MLLVPNEARQSPIHGLGVFATAFIAKGTAVWQFDPGIDKRHPTDWVERQPPHVRRFLASYGVKSLDGQFYYLAGDQTLFINHSLTPNMAPDSQRRVHDEEVVVATRDIQPGEELTINYGEIDGADRDKLSRGEALF
jgi:hypothetical protein